MAFIFGGNTPWTYEDLQRKRAVAESLLAGAGAAPRNVGEGLNAIGKALAYRGIEKRAAKEEARLRDEFNAKWGSVMGGVGGASGGSGGGYTPSGTWTPAPPKPDAVEVMQGTMQGGLSFPGLPKANLGGGADLSFGSATMTPQEMLIEGAKARGLNPIDVATAISYETGGKFDPMISGPTTQWGTHRGLIQFGEPQAKQYGADFSDPTTAMRSQLDPTSGAVWNYLDQTGVQPGMGLPEIYSAINAGSVGRMGASDANNGGAPGTVADKVAGMGPHREKAAAFLGGTWTPNGGDVTMSAMGAEPSMGMDIASLAALAGDPMASPQQKAIVEALIGQQMAMMDPMRRIEMERAQLELAQMKDPGTSAPETLTERQALLAAAGIDPASPEGKNYLLTGEMPEAPEPGFVPLSADEAAALGLPPGSYQRGPNGEIKQIGGGGTSVTVNNGAGENEFDKALGKSDAEAYSTITGEALSAADGIATLGAMEAAMSDPNFYSGSGAGMVETLQRGAVALGIADPSSVTSMESFNALAKNAALSAMGGTLGAGFSNADRDFVEKQVPTLGNTAEGNREIIRIQKAILQRKQEMAALAADYDAKRRAEGKRFDSAGFAKVAQEYALANPLFSANPPETKEPPAPTGVMVFDENGDLVQ